MADIVLNLISRKEWQARDPKFGIDKLQTPVTNILIHHGAGDNNILDTIEKCKKTIRYYQDLHMDEREWLDIGYNFVVGEDGNIYEGRGWNNVGAHAKGCNSDSIGICVMGNFNDRIPNKKALDAIKLLINFGLRNGFIKDSYVLKGHRNVGNTLCPGEALYNEIKKWPHFV